MAQSWKLSVWGVRGSFPKPGPEQAYGGNTSCFSVDCGGTTVVLDAGSGLVPLGGELVKRGVRRIDLLVSHLHLDHIVGMVSFLPVHEPEAELNIYGPRGMRAALETLCAPPYWPLGFDRFEARIALRELEPGEGLELPGVRVDTMRGVHPGDCLYYRLDGAGKRLVYALDCEPGEADCARLAEFASGADLLIWDASFAPGEVMKGWGHSTWEQGASVREAAGAARALMTHYGFPDPDEKLVRQEALVRERDPACIFAREGMVIEL